ncbi:AraC family transcriptional regulator [Nocardiopsis rhodophaea]|uniref:AraC family transcriptional regulator n=1 Tax=Nocardiopsis rhodophaea TaxID=280238 RepID=A0ABP5E5M7_9ACTN
MTSVERVVAVLAVDGVVGFDLSVPCQVFGMAADAGERPRYEIRVCALRPGPMATAEQFGAFSFHPSWGSDALGQAHTIVVPGYEGFLDEPPEDAVAALRSAAKSGVRIASVCTGAFLLAASGLLDGGRATTHWRYAAELARRHPAVEVDPAVLFVDNGQVLTSAGVASGLDMCLHLVSRDYGASAAAATARRLVMPLQRGGGQAQYLDHEPPPSEGASAGLQPTLEWMEANLDRPLGLKDIARQAGLSVRSLNRHFREQVGTTPLQWLLRARVHRAQRLLETTDLAVDRVAERSGFGSAATLRHHFSRVVETSPQSYRRAFSLTTASDD